jgi:hypothetical protein
MTDSDEEEERKDIRKEVQTKRVAFSTPPAPPVKSTIDEVEDLAQKMHGLDIGDVAYSGCYTCLVCLAPAAAQAWAPPHSQQLAGATTAQTPMPYMPLPPLQHTSSSPTNLSCSFCGGTHPICACSIAEDYLRAGRIIRDGQYFVYPDQSRIRRTGNENLRQAIDARYAIPSAPTPATGSNTIPVDSQRRENTPQTVPSAEVPSSAFISDSYFLQCVPVVENHAIVVTMEEDTSEELGGNVNAVTRSKAKASNNEETMPKPERKTPSSSRLIEALPAAPAPETKKPPAFTYESKAATPDAIQRVFKGILDITVPHLTVADLLAISPELRKKLLSIVAPTESPHLLQPSR